MKKTDRWKHLAIAFLLFCILTLVIYCLACLYDTPYSFTHTLPRIGIRAYVRGTQKKLRLAAAAALAVTAAGLLIQILSAGRKRGNIGASDAGESGNGLTGTGRSSAGESGASDTAGTGESGAAAARGTCRLLRIYMIACGIFLAGCLAFLTVRYGKYRDDPEGDRIIREQIRNQDIIHAAGQIDDPDGVTHTYTDSVEAVEACLAAGKRVMEIDFKDTTDGTLILSHRWKMFVRPDGTRPEDPLPLSETLECTVDGYFTPMTGEMLMDVMRENEDLYIVTDMKMGFEKGCKMLSKICAGMEDRFIVQIYAPDQYAIARDCGFRHIIFTLFRLKQDEEVIASFMRDLAGRAALTGFTMEDKRARKTGLPEVAAELGVPVYAHTVNTAEKKEKLLAKGVDAVYTDCVGPLP